MDLDGHIVEFLESGSLRLGYVRTREQRRVRVVDVRGRESSIPVSRVVVVHPAVAEEAFKDAAEALNERIERLSSEIDLELLWESVHTERGERKPSEFAESYFSASSPELDSAMFRALAAGGLLFKRNGIRFEPRSKRLVESERLRIARDLERERSRKHITGILNHAVQNGPPLQDPDWQPIAQQLELWLRRRERNPIGGLLEELVGEARSRETAYDLLLKSNRIEASEDKFLVTHGISTTFPQEVLQISDRMMPFQNDGSRANRGGMLTLAIDDDDTVEVDDALTVIEDPNHTIIGIHIADVSAFVAKDDPLDREAFRRSSTIYLPNVMVTMFPERLSADLASLVTGAARPAFTVEARFDPDDGLVDFRVHRTEIRVTERLSYESVDQRLQRGDLVLEKLQRIAERLCQDRTARGVQTHRRPEVKVKVTNGKVTVRRIDVDTPSRLIVSEMMILANRLAADKAAADGTPIIFRTQEPPDVAPPETGGLPEVIQFELLRRSFKRSRLSLSPGAHFGLGLSAYTQMSSPIRRYADLVTQRQFVAALEGDRLPYDREELLTIMTSAESAELDGRKLEQAATTYWVLTYLANEKRDASLQAQVVDKKGTVELTDYLVRGRVSHTPDCQPGDEVMVSIESIDPVRGNIRFRECS